MLCIDKKSSTIIYSILDSIEPILFCFPYNTIEVNVPETQIIYFQSI